MDVLKRSEFCGVAEKAFMSLAGIPKGTVFSARIGCHTNYEHVWIKTDNNAICIGMPIPDGVVLGSTPWLDNGQVYDYKVLNATLVIDD